MAQTVNVNFRLDEADKKRMENVCSELGLSMSAAFTIFAKKVGREHRIPFEISVDPFYSESNVRYLEEKLDKYNAGQLRLSEHELIEDWCYVKNTTVGFWCMGRLPLLAKSL